MTRTHLVRRTLTLGAVAAASLTSTAVAEARAPIRDCGDLPGGAGNAYAITAQGVDCSRARAVARLVPGKKACRPAAGGCTVRGFTCLVGQAGKELFLAHCENSNQTRFVRFEFGS